jgi:hypothetical protein
LNLSVCNLHVVCLITATTREWSASQSVHLNDRTSSILECCLLSNKIWPI